MTGNKSKIFYYILSARNLSGIFLHLSPPARAGVLYAVSPIMSQAQ